MPVITPPLYTGLGEIVKRLTRGACTERIVEVCTSVVSASNSTSVSMLVGDVIMGKVTLRAPAGTVAVVGTIASMELELRFTVTPPSGAIEVRLIVPVTVAPPVATAIEVLMDTS